uniref:hypothetical protein n=1 Tax=Owenweeksia hongkongensis TaxID=253245 RepID=UPI003A8CFEBE
FLCTLYVAIVFHKVTNLCNAISGRDIKYFEKDRQQLTVFFCYIQHRKYSGLNICTILIFKP